MKLPHEIALEVANAIALIDDAIGKKHPAISKTLIDRAMDLYRVEKQQGTDIEMIVEELGYELTEEESDKLHRLAQTDVYFLEKARATLESTIREFLNSRIQPEKPQELDDIVKLAISKGWDLSEINQEELIKFCEPFRNCDGVALKMRIDEFFFRDAWNQTRKTEVLETAQMIGYDLSEVDEDKLVYFCYTDDNFDEERLKKKIHEFFYEDVIRQIDQTVLDKAIELGWNVSGDVGKELVEACRGINKFDDQALEKRINRFFLKNY